MSYLVLLKGRKSCRYLVAGLSLAAAGCTSAPDALPGHEAGALKNNIIIILADDLGYGDVAAFGNDGIPTPNIDLLATEGTKFTNGYATAAVCAPSRAGLLAGRHQARFGWEFNPVGRDESIGIPAEIETLPELAESAGYKTAIIGKWHVGQSDGFHPLDQGFDEFYGVLGGATAYFPDGYQEVEADMGPVDEAQSRARHPIWDNREIVDPEDYLTNVFTDKAIDFIKQSGDQPFFLYFAPTAPHTPLQAAQIHADRFPDETDQFRLTYKAMVSALDDEIGRIRNALVESGKANNTVVIFLSDNGCASYIQGACSNQPLEGYKAYPWEGGIRVPFIVWAPGSIMPGQIETDPVSSLDIMPTAMNIIGADIPESADGVDILSDADRSQRPLFWRMGPNHAVRLGKWKLLVVNKSDQVQDLSNILGEPVPDGVPAEVSPLGQYVLLFNLAEDPDESHDLAAEYPEKVAELQDLFDAWDQSNIAPLFTSRRQFRTEVDGRRVQLFN
jgi:arylsulfatase A-like enzyme